jgi:hypothetical protein
MAWEVLRGRFAAVVITAVTAFLAGCGGSSSHTTTYPAKVRTNFLNACEQSTGAAYCNCTLKYIEAHVSLPTFAAADYAVRTGHKTAPKWFFTAATSCLSKQ